MQHVTDRARAANIPVGVSIGADPELVCAFLDMGVQWVSTGVDVMLMRAAAVDVLGKVKEHVKRR